MLHLMRIFVIVIYLVYVCYAKDIDVFMSFHNLDLLNNNKLFQHQQFSEYAEYEFG